MSKVLSLKLQEPIFSQTEHLIGKLHVPRNQYINQALEFYNTFNTRRLRGKQLHKESALVRNDSLAMLDEFDQLHDWPA